MAVSKGMGTGGKKKVKEAEGNVVDLAADKPLAPPPPPPPPGFIQRHPLLTIGGGIAAGLVIGALLPRRAGKAVVKRTSALSELVAATAVTLGQGAGEAGKALSKHGHAFADRAEDWTAVALRGASVLAGHAADTIAQLGESAADRAGELREAAVDRAGEASAAVSRQLAKAAPVAETKATKVGKRLGAAIADLRDRLFG